MVAPVDFPLVDQSDVAPAGKPDECFWCQQKIGQQHSRDCVRVKKLVRVRVTIDVELWRPHSWDARDVEWHLNESCSCANNILREVEEYADRLAKTGECLCSRFRAEYVEDVDPTPVHRPK